MKPRSAMPVDELPMKLLQQRHSTRRNFLKLGTAALSALVVSGCRQAEVSKPIAWNGYIDAHSHIWTSDTARFPLGSWITPDQMEPPSFTAEQLLNIAAPHRVDRVVIIQHAPYYGADNSYLIDCAQRFPGRFSIVAIVDERRDDLADHLRQLKQAGVRGIRIGPTRYADRTLVKEPSNWLKAAAMRKLWTLATDQDLILCPLISAEYLPTLDAMLTEFPNTKVVIDHFGHADVEEPDELQALLKLARHMAVSIKASGFYKFGDRKAPYDDLAPLMRHVTDTFGPNRVLWGSDCPYQIQNDNTYQDAVELIERGLEFLDSAARMAILRDNAQRLFFS